MRRLKKSSLNDPLASAAIIFEPSSGSQALSLTRRLMGTQRMTGRLPQASTWGSLLSSRTAPYERSSVMTGKLTITPDVVNLYIVDCLEASSPRRRKAGRS